MTPQECLVTQLFLDYSRNKTSTNYKKLYEGIMFYAYRFPLRFSQRNEEHKGDFVLFVEPKIPSIIDRFVYYGTPIEAYLYATFKGQFLSFIDSYNKKVQKSKLYYSNHSVLDIPTFVEEHHALYEKEVTKEQTVNLEHIITQFKGTRYFKVFSQRMWLYLQKYSPYLDEARIVELASLLGYSQEEVKHTLRGLSHAIHRVIENKIRHKEDCNRLFTKFIDEELKYNAKALYLGEEEKEEIEKKIEQVHNCYRKNYEVYKNMKFCISNEILAKLNGTTKGSVDSSLFHLRRMCSKYLTRGDVH